MPSDKLCYKGGVIVNQINIGKRIKSMREQTKLRQSQLAAYLGIDQSYLSKIESGERGISVEHLERLAELFGCEINAFESDEIVVHPVRFALRAKEITLEDMNIIATINHLANNSKYMARLLGEYYD